MEVSSDIYTIGSLSYGIGAFLWKSHGHLCNLSAQVKVKIQDSSIRLDSFKT